VFTPGAAAHGARDCFGAATAFTYAGNGPGEYRTINTVELMINDPTAVTTVWEIHLYDVTPPSAIADNGVFDIPSGDQASYLGFVSIPQTVDYGTTQYSVVNAVGKQIRLRGTSCFGYLVAVSAITSAAVAHTVTLHTGIVF
jgi:hypothetical protein